MTNPEIEPEILHAVAEHVCRNCTYYRPESPWSPIGDCTLDPSKPHTQTDESSCVAFTHYLRPLRQAKQELF